MRWRHAKGAAQELVTYVKDRPGHDRRYTWMRARLSGTGMAAERRWRADFARQFAGIENHDWVADVTSGSYRRWLQRTTQPEQH